MNTNDNLSIPDQITNVADSFCERPDEEMRGRLIYLINELINKDFSSLLQLLYRIDVSEEKIRIFLNQNVDDDAATILADLIIERQLQKIESRKRFSKNVNPGSDEERW